MRGWNGWHRVLGGLVVALFLGAAPAWASTPFQRGMVSITLDDGWPSQFTVARPALNARGIPATYFLVTEGTRNGWAGYVTVAQVQTLIAEGNEIGGHTMTHRDLTTLSATEVEAELRDSQAWLKTQFGLQAVPSFASPYGAYNASVLATIQQYYGSHRTVNSGQNFKDSNVLQLRAYDVHSGVSVATVRTWIDAAAADGSWIILTFHQFVTGTPTQSTEVNLGNFEAILDYIQTKNVDVVTVAEGVALMDGLPGGTQGNTVVYEDGMGDGFTDWSWATHDLGNRAVVHSGLTSLSAELDGWGGLFLHHTSGLDASQYSAIELWVHGGTTGGQGVRLDFFNGSQLQGSVRLDAVLGHPILAGTWQQVVVPLSAVGLPTGTVRDIYLQDNTGTNQATVYFDDIRLVRSGAPPPPPPPPTTPPFSLYAEGLGAGFDDWSWATHNLYSQGLVHAGASAISVELDSWSALFFNANTGVDLSRYKSLSLWVHGGTSGGQIARVLFRDGPNVLGERRLDQALGHAIQPGTWQRIVIPFSTLGLSTGTLKEFYLQDQSGGDQGTLYVDDIQLLP
ncbi:polysaccharide deacetylase family protein [Hyalangium rubrum]|uniref:Polysaccharide deacetylase family protein n=1 Tax=Hyalangium rubrum TaxID=3103134 RepID=A0ABU5HGX9_9BACT|nr:polysaccharide deacetylase family protein [Hyalangium sp. s54d21]MDY7232713.1 polysaccharide deacetylase family protein [Hyalangium sp. s54d21]